MRHLAIPITEIQAPSSAAECSRLRRIVCQLALAALRSPRAAADIELAIGEAFSNAVKYGGRGSKISVRVEIPSSREFDIEIAYPGSKFDTSVTRPRNVRKATGGFGRFIMQQVMDDLKYSFRNGHTTLRMKKCK